MCTRVGPSVSRATYRHIELRVSKPVESNCKVFVFGDIIYFSFVGGGGVTIYRYEESQVWRGICDRGLIRLTASRAEFMLLVDILLVSFLFHSYAYN